MMKELSSRNPAKALLGSVVILLLAGTMIPIVSHSTVVMQASGSGAAFDYVVTILMENNSYCDVMTTCGGSGTYMTSLAQFHSVVSQTGYTATSHTSEGNYITLIGGSDYGRTSDGYCCWGISAPHIIDRIEASGRTWQAWAEDASGSGACNFSPPRGGDHFAFLTFSDINTPSRCANFLSTTSSSDTEFLAALNAANPADYIWLTPNDNDNCHDTSIPACDSHVAGLVPKVLNSDLFKTQKAALFIVYDKGNGSYPSDWVSAAWAGSVVKTGYVGTGSYSHYSYSKTLEAVWNMPSLTSNDAGASAMTEFFGSCTSGCSGGAAPAASFTVSRQASRQVKPSPSLARPQVAPHPYTYSWSFGDGVSATRQTVTHVYSSAGSYSVNLDVSDSAGLSGSSTQALTVSAGSSPPPANLEARERVPSVLSRVFWARTCGWLSQERSSLLWSR